MVGCSSAKVVKFATAAARSEKANIGVVDWFDINRKIVSNEPGTVFFCFF